jgi:glycosyltransferase involved in cell wall biosynthesis
MKIFYFGYDSSPHRAPHQEMATLYLAHLGHSVDYACWGGTGYDPSVPHKNITYMPNPKSGIGSAIKMFAWLISKVAFSDEYDVLYVQGAQQTPFVFWMPLAKGNKRIVYHTQDYLEPRRHKFYERFERFFAKRADYVISNEVNRGRFMHSNYGLNNLPVIIKTALPEWWPIPERILSRRIELIRMAGLPESESYCLITAGGPYRADRMSPQLLEAFSKLPDHYVLIFIGDAMKYGQSCRMECELKMGELGIIKRVIFLEGMTYPHLLELYAACDVGVLLYPNNGIGHFYQCPGRLSEYLRCGLSLITCNYPGLELLTLKYRVGEVCDPEDAASIAEALLRVQNNYAGKRDELKSVANKYFVYEHDAPLLEAIIQGEQA